MSRRYDQRRLERIDRRLSELRAWRNAREQPVTDWTFTAVDGGAVPIAIGDFWPVVETPVQFAGAGKLDRGFDDRPEIADCDRNRAAVHRREGPVGDRLLAGVAPGAQFGQAAVDPFQAALVVTAAHGFAPLISIDARDAKTGAAATARTAAATPARTRSAT